MFLTKLRIFSVFFIAHGRHGHLQRLLDGVQRSTILPEEVIVVYMDDPTPEPVTCKILTATVHLESMRGENGLPLARARNTAAQPATRNTWFFWT